MSNKTKTTTPKPDGKPALTPKLRFPEFRDAEGWREGRIADIAEVLQGYGFPERYQGQKAGEYPFYKVSDISNTLAAGKVFISESANYITEGVLKELKAKPIPEGTTIFAKIGEAIRSNRRAITTKPCLIDNNAAGVNRIEGKSTDLFLYFTMETIPLIEYSGGVVPAVNKSAIQNIAVKFPKIEEQQKIAECLSSVDELMAAQARKLDALKTHKKGLMQQLFPREGETQPRLRFPEFQNAGEWEETRLGQLGKLISGLTYSPDDVRENGLLVLRSSNVQNGKISLDDCVYVDPDIKGVNLAAPNDILICVRNGSSALIGKNALLPEGMPLCTHGAFMTVFRTKSAKFVFQLFQTAKYQKQVAGDLGATINSINGSQLIKYKFAVPKPAEQQKIADLLSSIDDLVAAQTQKLDALKTHRKGLMQQLFPTPAEIEA